MIPGEYNNKTQQITKGPEIMDKLYSIAEISRLTGVPPSTIAYYRDKYQQYFPTVGKGKKKEI